MTDQALKAAVEREELAFLRMALMEIEEATGKKATGHERLDHETVSVSVGSLRAILEALNTSEARG